MCFAVGMSRDIKHISHFSHNNLNWDIKNHLINKYNANALYDVMGDIDIYIDIID